MKENPRVKIKEVLKELKLEDIKYEEASTNSIATRVSGNLAGITKFVGKTVSSTTLSATLQFTNIGVTKIDTFVLTVVPYSGTPNGGWVQYGSLYNDALSKLKPGITVVGKYKATVRNKAAKLVGVSYYVDKGKVVPLSNAVLSYRK